ncbi:MULTISPECIES: hypothetical protein [Burkholderiaceae]|uniref:hypothetical protein n=1 Tax=Burkholderiaceae TaxID=119060 RepID=UPI00041023F0|nr:MULTISPECIES: hypothetical protein [Burkholderiaceae]PZR38300.1 MAG: hypothetical protein DI523_38615 [Paraburkholderia fungorum]
MSLSIEPGCLLYIAIAIGAIGFITMAAESINWGAVAVAAALSLAGNIQWARTDPASFSSWGWILTTAIGAIFGARIHFACQAPDLE